MANDRGKVARVESLSQPVGHEDDSWATDGLPPVAGALSAKSHAELHMHSVARAALMNRLMSDPDVVALYERWAIGTWPGQTTLGFRERLDRAAQAIGRTSWAGLMQETGSEFWRTGEFTVEVDVADDDDPALVRARFDEALDDAARLGEALVAAVEEVDSNAALWSEAVALVRDRWKLPWPWLAWELVRCWYVCVCDVAFDQRSYIRLQAVSFESDPPAPPLDWVPGEPLSKAMARLYREAHASVDPLPKGKKTAPEIVRRYVDWWYRVKIGKESIRSIGGEWADSTAEGRDDGRKLVAHGIARAEGWLGVASYRWQGAIDP